MIASMCNMTTGVAVLDFAYLALNVYHTPGDEKYLGIRPALAQSINELIKRSKEQQGWFQLDFSELRFTHDFGFHAEFYAKVYNGKIQHFMTAFRGTAVNSDYAEDVLTWWNTALPGSDHYAQALPHYFGYARSFIMICNNVIKDLDDEELIAQYCGQHVTGHSLGGAMANLVAAESLICKPAYTKSILPVLPEIISFNAPGIAGMPIVESAFSESMVISMRAHYDAVSALGKPYGFVINNQVPEGNDDARTAFNIQESTDHFNLKNVLCDIDGSCSINRRIEQATEGGAVFQQHLMGNFIDLILKQPDTIAIPFVSVRQWAENHGGLNHNFNGPCLYSESAAAMAA